MKKSKLKNIRIAVSIPYYNASRHIADVVSRLPDYIDTVIIVDDCGREPLPEDQIRLQMNPEINLVLLKNPKNLGVGGASKLGFRYAVDHGFDIVIKVDADDQMDTSFLPQLIKPLTKGRCEMSKGNRFRDVKALKSMPVTRRIGNLALSFLTKAATGYWNNFDPNNGFIAIKVSALRHVDFDKLADRYFFETSLLAQLYFNRARVLDVSMPAIYASEKSSMVVWRMPLIFSINLIKVFLRRIGREYFLHDFNIASLYIITGLPLFAFGVIYGIINWIYYSSHHLFAPMGTIMLVTLSVILGFQLLLQAIQYDIINAPKSQVK